MMSFLDLFNSGYCSTASILGEHTENEHKPE